MKNFIFILLPILLFVNGVNAAGCSGQSQVIVTIVPNNAYYGIHWSLYDGITNVLIDTGAYIGDTVCVDSNRCMLFTIYNDFGNGLCCGDGIGYCTVTLNGVLVDSAAQFSYSQFTYFNCPPGYDCNLPFQAVFDTMTAPFPNSWYVFTADSTGIYSVGTCGLGNTCQTKVWVYDRCAGLIPTDAQEGSILYNVGGCDTTQSVTTGVLQAGSTYYVRIGENDTSCTGKSIKWVLAYLGPIPGCTDTPACNYNPVAGVDNGTCLYYPNPLCPKPDLALVDSDLVNQLMLDTITSQTSDCYVYDGCLTGYGLRQIIRFTTNITNVGNFDYYLGIPDSSNPDFEYDICHHHWHYAGYAEYLLFNSHQQELQVSFKDGFCVEDLGCNAGLTPKYSCDNMGISADCYDIYGSFLDCQWVDITDVDTGYYTLAVQVNWMHKPDAIGHYEARYDNNWAQVCLHLYYDSTGKLALGVVNNCPTYIDCSGDTFGSAQRDCAGVCNGSHVMGDLDSNQIINTNDVLLYMTGIVNQTIPYSYCDDLNGDSTINVVDAAWLNGCILFNEGLNNTYPNRKHCQFPFNIINQFDTVVFSIADVDWGNHYVDLSVYNSNSLLLAYELKLHGLVIDSIQNLATGNYSPNLYSSSLGYIAGISLDNNALDIQNAPINFIRVYYSCLTDTIICIDTVIAAVNSNYEVTLARAGNNCSAPVINSIESSNISAGDVSIIPNPSGGSFDVYFAKQSLYGAEINITDALGRMIFEAKEETLSNKMRIDLSNHASGVYFLHIRLDGADITKRVLIVGL